MNSTNERPARRRHGLALGAVSLLTGSASFAALLFCVDWAGGPQASACFRAAGPISAVSTQDIPDRPKRDAAARRAVESFLRALAKKDAKTMAALCDVPFLGGPYSDPWLTSDLAKRDQSLKDLCGGAYLPYMTANKWDVSEVLSPREFQQKYTDYLEEIPGLGKLLPKLKLMADDRLVIEKGRGMLLVVSGKGGMEPRVIGVVPVGFQPRAFRLDRNVIYGRKYGTALTMDVLHPIKNGNRAAILSVVSDTFVSFPPRIGPTVPPLREQLLLDAGYTLVYVTHSGSPKNTIPEIVADVHRAVRFVRYHADKFEIDSDRIGIMGGSSGGYLALAVGIADGRGPTFPPKSDPTGQSQLNDPIETIPSRVQAVVAYFPPTDWLNYGEKGKTVFDNPAWRQRHGVLDLYEFDASRTTFNKITDPARIGKELTELSLVHHVARQAAPTLLFHGQKDNNVPLQQSQRMEDALKGAGVPVELVVKPDVGHGWADNKEDTAKIIAWCNRYLLRKE